MVVQSAEIRIKRWTVRLPAWPQRLHVFFKAHHPQTVATEVAEPRSFCTGKYSGEMPDHCVNEAQTPRNMLGTSGTSQCTLITGVHYGVVYTCIRPDYRPSACLHRLATFRLLAFNEAEYELRAPGPRLKRASPCTRRLARHCIKLNGAHRVTHEKKYIV